MEGMPRFPLLASEAPADAERAVGDEPQCYHVASLRTLIQLRVQIDLRVCMQFRACLRRIFGFSLSGQAIVNFGRASAGYECRKCFDIRTEKVAVFFSVQLERRSAGAIFLKY